MGIKLYQPHIPTIIGAGAIGELGNAVKQLRRNKPLLICGMGTRMAGIAGKAEKSLKDAGVDYVVFDHARPDPDTSLIDEIVMESLKAPCDCVIGLGGGSNLDAAKATSIMMGLRGKMSDILGNHPQFFDAAVPIILVPTTAGSGSEVSNATVIINSKTGVKVPSLVNSTLAIIDPELACSLSPRSTAITGMDALAHAVEGMMSIYANERVDMYALSAIEKIMKYLPAAVADGCNIEAREQMAYASNWAGRVTFDAAPNLAHAMSEGFLQDKSLPHGLPCAWALPEAIAFTGRYQPETVRKIAKVIGVTFADNESIEAVSEKCAEALRQFMKKIGIPTPEEEGVNRRAIINNPQLKAVKDWGYPINLDDETAKRLMEKSYDNYTLPDEVG